MLKARIERWMLGASAFAVASAMGASGCGGSGGAGSPSPDGGRDVASAHDAGPGSDGKTHSDASDGGVTGKDASKMSTAAAVPGPSDMHCAGMPAQPTNQADCHATPPPDSGSASPYGVTMDNAAGDDDDCKYHLTWTSTPVAENVPVTFTVTATYKTNGTPNPPACTACAVTGAKTIIEAYLSDTHPAPASSPMTTESPAGTYTIGPIEFDAPGDWTVRFHLFETCVDSVADSPEGSAAFYVRVP